MTLWEVYKTLVLSTAMTTPVLVHEFDGIVSTASGNVETVAKKDLVNAISGYG